MIGAVKPGLTGNYFKEQSVMTNSQVIVTRHTSGFESSLGELKHHFDKLASLAGQNETWLLKNQELQRQVKLWQRTALGLGCLAVLEVLVFIIIFPT